MAWLNNSGCERCGVASADVSCDACGEKLCCECANILNCALTDSKGNLYLHMCDDCADQISTDEEGMVYNGPRLVIDNTRKKDV
jgi:hypothetical protein